MYILTAHFLQHADAAFFNISLLSSDAWAAFAAAVVFGDRLTVWYWVSLVIVVGGALAFHLLGGDPAQETVEVLANEMEPLSDPEKEEATQSSPISTRGLASEDVCNDH